MKRSGCDFLDCGIERGPAPDQKMISRFAHKMAERDLDLSRLALLGSRTNLVSDTAKGRQAFSGMRGHQLKPKELVLLLA